MEGYSSPTMNRRGFLRSAVGGVVGTSLLGAAGCRGFGGGGSSGERLTVTWWGEGKRSQRTVRVGNLFQQKNSGVTVDGQPTSYDGYYEKLTTRVAGGDPPDIFQLHITTLVDYAERGAVRKLGDLWDGPLDLGKVPERVRAASSLDGTPYFVPLGVATQPGCVYNRTMLHELGVDEPQLAWTIRDFQKFTETVRRASGGKVYGTTDMGGDDVPLLAFARSQGMNLFTKDGKLGIGKDLLHEWFSLWQELRASKRCVPMQVTAGTTGFENNPLTTGRSALNNVASSKGIRGYANLIKDELRLRAFPKHTADGPQGTVLGPVEWWAFRSELPDEQANNAARFCNFYLTNPESLSVMKTTHGVPIFRDLRQQRYDNASGLAKLVYDNVREVAKQDPDPLVLYPSGARELAETVLSELNQKIGFGKTTVQSAVDEFFENAERVLSA